MARINKNIGQSVTTKEILEYLELTQSELTDAYNTAPDTSENSDSLYFIDTARELLDELQTRLEEEGKFLPHPGSVNDGGIGHDMGGSYVNDGEGRLKGNN